MREIPLTQGRVALVDNADYEWLSQYKWTWVDADSRKGYATHYYRTGKRVSAISMHRLIMEPPDGLQVDHINGDGLDNRRENLRLCTQGQNLRNQVGRQNRVSEWKGVVLHKPSGKWMAQIGIDRRKIYLGYYETPELAALAYNEAALKYHGDFARLNTVAASALPRTEAEQMIRGVSCVAQEGPSPVR